ncbi:hypothetical protein MHYP_G00164360 [Metynnis hypsauchen]
MKPARSAFTTRLQPEGALAELADRAKPVFTEKKKMHLCLNLTCQTVTTPPLLSGIMQNSACGASVGCLSHLM